MTHTSTLAMQVQLWAIFAYLTYQDLLAPILSRVSAVGFGVGIFATAALVFWFCHRLNQKKDRK